MTEPKKIFSFILLIITLPLISFGQIQIGNDIDGLSANENFGTDVSISSDGTIVAASAYGIANEENKLRVLKNINGVWTLLGTDSAGGNFNGIISFSVSLSSDGHTLAPGTLGSVKVFNYSTDTGIWLPKGNDIINNTSISNNYGYSISLSDDGNTVAIGTPDNPIVPSSGVTQVFQFETDTWNQIGNDIDGLTFTEHSGRSIDLSSNGKILAILNDNSARVYENVSGTWTQLGTDISAIGNQFSNKAISLSTDGRTLAIGESDFTGSLIQQGRVRVFSYSSGSWNQIGNTILGEALQYRTGASVSLSANGNILAIGEIGSTSSSTDKGRTRLFENQNGTWTQIGISIIGEGDEDHSGGNISLSSDASTLAINACLNDGNAVDAGHVRVYDLNATLSNYDLRKNDIILFPNPTNNYFEIKTSNNSNIKSVELIDVTGKTIKQFKKSETYSIKDITSGIYFVKIKTEKSQTIKRLVKI